MLPLTIGAAIDIEHLETYRDWLRERPRDLELQDFVDPAILMDPEDAISKAKQLLDGFEGRLGIHGPFKGFSLSADDPEIVEVAARRLTQGVAAAEALGATQMVAHSPFTTWDYNNLDTRAGARARKLEQVHAVLGPAAARAREAGVEIVIENIEDIAPADRRTLAASFDGDVVKVSIDTGHAQYAYGSTGAPPVDVFVRDAGAALAHVHLQDADGHADRHWAIGRGTIRWHAVFAALAELGGVPRLVLELHDRSEIPESMAWLSAQGLGR